MPSAPAWPNCFHDRSLRSLSALLWAGGGAAELSMGLASVGRYDRPAESYVLSKVSLSLSLYLRRRRRSWHAMFCILRGGEYIERRRVPKMITTVVKPYTRDLCTQSHYSARFLIVCSPFHLSGSLGGRRAEPVRVVVLLHAGFYPLPLLPLTAARTHYYNSP
jgi:hypothetical protein